MGGRSGLGRQSRRQELCPRGVRCRKALGQSPEETWPRGAALKGLSHTRASLDEGFQPGNVQRVGLLSGSLQSCVPVLRLGSLLSRTPGQCGRAAAPGRAPMGALLRRQPGTRDGVGVPGGSTNYSQGSLAPGPRCAGDAQSLNAWLISVVPGRKPGRVCVVPKAWGWQGLGGRNGGERQCQGQKPAATRGCALPGSGAERVHTFLPVRGAKLRAETQEPREPDGVFSELNLQVQLPVSAVSTPVLGNLERQSLP